MVSFFRNLLLSSVVALTYVVAAKLSYLLRIPPDVASIVWLPSGICMGIMLFFGWRAVPGIFLGSLFFHMGDPFLLFDGDLTTLSVATYLLNAMWSVLQAFVGSWLILRILKEGKVKLDYLFFLRMCLIALLVSLVSSTLSIGLFVLLGKMVPAFAFRNWLNWSFGDFLGIISILPMIVLWYLYPKEKSKSGKLKYLIPFGVYLLALFASFNIVNRLEESQLKQRFDYEAENLELNITKDIEDVFQGMDLLKLYFLKGNSFSSQEFSRFAAEIIEKHPSLQAVNWIPVVRFEDRTLVKRKVEEELGLGIHFLRRIEDDMIEVPEQDELGFFTPILYIVPFENNKSVLGLDLSVFSKEALVSASTSGLPQMLPPIRLAQETGSQVGMVCYIPIAQANWFDLANEYESLEYGYLDLVWRMDDFLSNHLSHIHGGNLEILLLDNTDENDVRVLSHYKENQIITDESSGTIPCDVPLKKISEIEIAGRSWELMVCGLPGYLAENRSNSAWVVLVGGFIIASLFGLFSLQIYSRSKEIEDQVSEKTRELKAEKDKAEKMAKAKMEFVSTMSHEIRTPMNGLISTSQLMCMSKLTERQRKLMEIIDVSSRSLLSLINDIMDYSKLESGKQTLEILSFDPRKLAQDQLNLFHAHSEKMNVDFKLIEKLDTRKHLMGDRMKIGQILSNILSNAFKFTVSGSVTIRMFTRMLRNGKVELRYEIEDTGCGISEDVFPALFDAYTQADVSTSRKYGGSGLGLSISKNLCELMHGTISVESRESIGSVFKLTLQLDVAPEPEIEKVSARSPESSWSRGGLVSDLPVLVVEDNATNWEVIKFILGKIGVKCQLAVNGQEAIQKWQTEKYLAIFMDCQMPVLDGYEATERIRDLEGGGDRIPILAMTANTMTTDRERCTKAGMDDFLSKPISLDAVKRVLQGLGLKVGK